MNPKNKSEIDKRIRFLIFEQTCADMYGYNIAKLSCGTEIQYTTMVKPECFNQYKNGKVQIIATVEIEKITEVQNIFDTPQSQEYFKYFIDSEKSKELKRIKLLREKSPLNLILSPDKNKTSLELICSEKNA